MKSHHIAPRLLCPCRESAREVILPATIYEPKITPSDSELVNTMDDTKASPEVGCSPSINYFELANIDDEVLTEFIFGNISGNIEGSTIEEFTNNFFETQPKTRPWQEKPMRNWNSNDVLNFIYNQISEERIAADLSQFKSISGYIFQNLDEHYCVMLSKSQYFGHKIYTAKQKYTQGETQDQEETYNNIRHSLSSSSTTDTEEVESHPSLYPTVRKIGRPRTRPFNKLGNKRTEKLWEFLIHLLQDPATCPDLIKWENFDDGTFKFVRSDKVARLWGSRKLNSKMTYEKFSRAMRYYYRSQVLLPVPGKRLVYKFGPNATGWNAVAPIL